MKKLLAFLFLALFSLAASAQWVTSGIIVNPTANQIICDAGAVADTNSHEWDIYVSSTVAAAFIIEWRDAANAANVWSHIVPVTAGTIAPVFTQRGGPTMQAGERVRVRMNAAATGSVQCSINFF
jgi:hypothetical protein